MARSDEAEEENDLEENEMSMGIVGKLEKERNGEFITRHNNSAGRKKRFDMPRQSSRQYT